MDRRKFLKVLGIGAAAPALARGQTLEDVVIEIAPKIEAKRLKGSGVVTSGGLAKDMWPGIDKWFNENYLYSGKYFR